MSLEINSNYENYSTQINDNSANNVKRTNETTSKQVSVDEYKKTLMDKFSFLGKTTSMSGGPTTVSISSKYLAKCANDPELAQKLEENLKAIPSSISLLNSRVGMASGSPVVTYANISVDANGNISCVSGSTNDPDGKIAKQNSKDKVQSYYEDLCKRFPQININTNGSVLQGNANKATVNISQACLEKMANDPEFAKEIEWNLSGEAAAHSLINGWAKRDGVEIYGRTVTYDADGNRQSSCGMRTANTDNKGFGINIKEFQNKYKKEEDNWLNTRRKEWEEKLAEQRNKDKERWEELIANQNNLQVNLYGTDIESIIKQLEEKFEAGLLTNNKVFSYDIRVE